MLFIAVDVSLSPAEPNAHETAFLSQMINDFTQPLHLFTMLRCLG